jgi:hypothetical protein
MGLQQVPDKDQRCDTVRISDIATVSPDLEDMQYSDALSQRTLSLRPYERG